jgi:hypothetical protein
MLHKIRAKRQSGPGHHGASLLNLIFTLGIPAVGLLVIASAFPPGAETVSASESGAALALAYEKLNELRSLPMSSPALKAGAYSDEVNPYSRYWTVTADTPIQGMKRINVLVEWDSSQGTSQVVLNTYVTSWGGRADKAPGYGKQ